MAVQEMTWHRELPADSAKDILDIVAKALLLRAGGNVTLSGDEMRRAREVQAEFRRCDNGALSFRVERQ